ncbi:hypothetical protein ACP26L_15545 [Paenibacillus sp. S-38]|uniref:hypothetical protein n=1 Tax=Paenibacillus sp. S-38 TaxID=3416710 RepID=UPI003CF68A6A
MRKQMTDSEWRGQLVAWKKSRTVIEGMDIIDKLIAESEHEMELATAKKEKTRRSGRASLRSRLKFLMLLFYHRTNVRGKGASPDA